MSNGRAHGVHITTDSRSASTHDIAVNLATLIGFRASRRRTLLACALSSRWLWVQLAGGLLLLALLVTDFALVETRVSCATYRQTIQGLPGEVAAYSGLFLGGGSFLFRVSAQIVARRGLRAIGLSLAVFALELAIVIGVLALVSDKTLFYCAFEGVKLSPCELGFCVH